jgi:RsiW-degrading membrane proteinase PrsW (M82 family)
MNNTPDEPRPKPVQPAVKHSAEVLQGVVADLKSLNFREEIVPLDANILQAMRRDVVFWSAVVLAVVPLVLTTLEGSAAQITGFCLFAAALWGVIFARFIVNSPTSWKMLVSAMLFTGIIGIPILIFIYGVLPKAYNTLPESKSLVTALLGSVLHTGVTEELCKIVPVLIFVFWKGTSVKPLDIVLIGVFSGLGFAAFENVDYASRSVNRAFVLTGNYGAEGLAEGVKGAMVNVLLRSLSLVFARAVWSGIFAYFVAMAVTTQKRMIALFLIGLATAATLHGAYNGSSRIQQMLPAAIILGSFVLFYCYLTRLRLAIAEDPNDVESPVLVDG